MVGSSHLVEVEIDAGLDANAAFLDGRLLPVDLHQKVNGGRQRGERTRTMSLIIPPSSLNSSASILASNCERLSNWSACLRNEHTLSTISTPPLCTKLIAAS